MKRALFVCLFIWGIAGNAAMARETAVVDDAFLIDRVPAEALGYIRIPNPWGFFSAPKDSVLKTALAQDAHLKAVATLRSALGEKLLQYSRAPVKPLVELLLQRARSPVEAMLLVPPNAEMPLPNLFVTATTDIPSVADCNQFLAGMAQTHPHLMLLAEMSPDGFATLNIHGFPCMVHFTADAQRMSLMGGPTANQGIFQEILNGLTSVVHHELQTLEAGIDASHQGLFIWVNSRRVLPVIRPFLAPDQVMLFEKWGLFDMRAVVLGWGVQNGKGCLKLLVDAPKSGYREYLPEIQNTVSLTASGEPVFVIALSLPALEVVQAMRRIAQQENNPQLTEGLDQADAVLSQKLNLSLETILGAIGPEFVGFMDAVGSYAAVKIRDPSKWRQVLTTLSDQPDLHLETVDINGRRYYHLATPLGLMDTAGLSETVAQEKVVQSVLGSMRFHWYWMEDEGYLVFAQVPQALIDRQQFMQRVPIALWMTEHQHQDLRRSIFNFSVDVPGKPQRIYYLYLQMLTLLSDLADRPLDIFSLPTAADADLPPSGTYGVQLDLSDPYVALTFTFENNPLEFLLENNMTVASLGVLTAIAVPNFVSYRNRAVCALVEAEAHSAVTSLSLYFMKNEGAALPTLAALSDQTGYTPHPDLRVALEGTREAVVVRVAHRSKTCDRGSYYLITMPESGDNGWHP